MTSSSYGTGDASYRAAGGADGIDRLVHRFYEHMETLPEARALRAMHAADLTEVRDKLAVFLVAWLGGPNEYRARFGAISIPGFHARCWHQGDDIAIVSFKSKMHSIGEDVLDGVMQAIDEAERDAWLLCMARAVHEQPWAEAFKLYFIQAIAVPAERVRAASVRRRADS